METLREEIITSETAERMVGRVSPIYDQSYVGLWLFEAIGREYDMLWDIARTMPDQLVPDTATWTIELWELRYGITPHEGQTLEERRRAVKLARSVPSPFNPASLQRYIKNLTGRDSEIVDNVSSFTFGVYITQSDTMGNTDLDRLISYINRHKPSHMSYELGMQSVSEILVGVETGYWRFPYPMAGTAEAGTIPDINIQAAINAEALFIDTGANGYLIPYPLAGTLPDINTINGTGMAAVVAAGGGETYKAPYIPCGTLSAGTAI